MLLSTFGSGMGTSLGTSIYISKRALDNMSGKVSSVSDNGFVVTFTLEGTVETNVTWLAME